MTPPFDAGFHSSTGVRPSVVGKRVPRVVSPALATGRTGSTPRFVSEQARRHAGAQIGRSVFALPGGGSGRSNAFVGRKFPEASFSPKSFSVCSYSSRG